jgi:putative transcription factor
MASSECEMCGKKVQKTTKIRVDSAILNVCDACAKFGRPVENTRSYTLDQHVASANTVVMPEKPKYSPPPVRPKQAYRKPKDDIENLDIDPDYAIIIREAREKLSWTQEELARKLQERKNVLSSIERGELMPDVRVARKLEKLLEVKIVQKG